MPSVRDRMTPLFLGGSLTSPAFLPRPKRKGRFKADNSSEMRLRPHRHRYVGTFGRDLGRPPLASYSEASARRRSSA